MRFSDITSLKLNDYLGPGELFHVHRESWLATPARGYHRHDFAEMFWITEGSGVHHVNGATQPLAPGVVIAIRVSDCHWFETAPGRAFSFVNVAFPSRFVQRLNKVTRETPWQGGSLPRRVVLGTADWTRLGEYADDLLADRSCALGLTAFLSAAARLLQRGRAEEALRQRVPQWLQRAMLLIREPAHFRGGVREFARLAGRSPEHTSRELLRWTGRRPSDLLREARLHWARRELAMTDRTVAAIASDCGFDSASHFHALFKQETGKTPSQFRRSIQNFGA